MRVYKKFVGFKGIPMVNQRKPPGGEGLGLRVGSLGEGFGFRGFGGRGGGRPNPINPKRSPQNPTQTLNPLPQEVFFGEPSTLLLRVVSGYLGLLRVFTWY